MEFDKGQNPTCIFCGIAAGVTMADVVYDGGDTIFFRDINPKARVHIVGIPKEHITSLAAVADDNLMLLGKLLHDASVVASQQDLGGGGYRVVTNVGSDAGQEVDHMHIHILGGESLGPLRC